MWWMLLFIMLTAVQLAYWAALHHGLQKARRRTRAGLESEASVLPPISVVIAARDEEENLPDLLCSLAEQSHPRFEVVLVNDASQDRTAEIADRWAQSGDFLRVVNIERPRHPRKKHALTRGIAEARHELLAFTDADCRLPPHWLETLAAHHSTSDAPSVLVGYSPYHPAGGLLKKLARFETFLTGLYTAAAAGLGRPYMAVGRNLSYTKTVFDHVGGFEHSLQLLSGDDDLFVQRAARSGIAVKAVLDPESFILTDAPDSWKAWFRQKRRHASAGRFYSRPAQIHLTAFHASDVLCWLAPVVLGWAGLGLLGAKLLAQGTTLVRAADVLHEEDLLVWMPLLAPLYTAYITIVEPIAVLRMPRQW